MTDPTALMGVMRTRLIWALQSQRGHRLPFVAVAFGVGVGAYFSLPFEPNVRVLGAIALAALAAFAVGYWLRETFGGVAVVLGVACLGLLIAALRTHSVAAPVLTFRYYGAIEGRIVKIDRSASDKMRLTLDRVRLANMSPDRTPKYVRVSLHGAQPYLAPAPGQRVMMTGHLSPPNGPTEPGGFDFQRHAWFQSMGGVGYTRTPALLAAPDPGELWLQSLRARIAAGLADRIGGQAGGVAAAVAVGDRAGIDAPTMEDLRASNLAHLLAISGLHMGLLAGFVFMSVRGGLAMISPLALRYPIKKWAALVALPAAAFYLALSGGSVATQRAFIQVAVMLAAILCDRRALTLRSVAIAALIVLAWRPEALLGPGFQMSFAATTAMVVIFSGMRGHTPRLPMGVAQVSAVLMSSIIAGAATAPISAAHFNQIGQYGVLANLLSVPMMGTIVMPLMVVAAVLSPFGLEGVALWGMALGLDWILWVSAFVAGLDGALRLIPAPSNVVLPLLCLGCLWCIAWQGRARWIGVVPAIAAFALWSSTPRPLVLISASGNLVGVQTSQGRALSKPRGDGFVAQNWLAADGLPKDQEQAAARWSMDAETDHGLVHLYGRGAQDRVAQACRRSHAVVANKDYDAPEGCLFLSPTVLRSTGAIAVTQDGRVITSRQTQGNRPWVPRAGQAPDLAPLQYVRMSPTSRP